MKNALMHYAYILLVTANRFEARLPWHLIGILLMIGGYFFPATGKLVYGQFAFEFGWLSLAGFFLTSGESVQKIIRAWRGRNGSYTGNLSDSQRPL